MFPGIVLLTGAAIIDLFAGTECRTARWRRQKRANELYQLQTEYPDSPDVDLWRKELNTLWRVDGIRPRW